MADRRSPAHRSFAVAALAALLIAASACDRDDSSSSTRKEPLTPQFGIDEEAGPAAGASTTTSTAAEGRPGAAAGSAPTTIAAGTDGEPASSASAATTGEAPVESGTLEASIDDPSSDVTPSPLDRPPAWADLTGVRLVRSPSGFELRVRLGGPAAPDRAPDDAHTMNIASFYDLDGDGGIDTEIWLNVASGGWGATWFDNVGDGGGFQEGSGVTVGPDGQEVVARFPLSHLGAATRFRWSIASEWGRYETIGTIAAARDDAPDNDNPARFPSA